MRKNPNGDEWYRVRGKVRRKGWVENGIGYIPLTKGRVALVDPPFVEEINKTCLQWQFTHGYAAAKTKEGRRVYLHKVVYEIADNVQPCDIDHRNLNPLDCRMANLRFAERWQNQVNRGLQRNNTTGFKGVYLVRGRYSARIKRHGKTRHLGCYETAEEAAKVYDREALAHDGEFARLNFPPQGGSLHQTSRGSGR